jgi:glycosyltransferase involved in cell wall biosynthesis
MRVLYVNHTSHMSGGERSLLSLLGGLPGDVRAHVACPGGPLADAVRQLGVDVLPLPGTAGSLKLHPTRTPRAVAELTLAALAVRRHARAVQADLVHANSIRAGLTAGMAARLGGPPAISHVRDCLPPGRVSSLTRRLVSSMSAVVLANSRHTAARFAVDGTRAAVLVAHSPIDLRQFDPARVDRIAARDRLGLAPSDVALGVIGQLTPWKGQDDAVRATAEVRRVHPDVRLLLAGSAKFVSGATRHDNLAYVRRLEELVEQLGLREHVSFLGERDDVPELMRALDVLLVPSWEEPYGRAVVEAMAMGVPVIATEVGGPAEIIRDGEGVLLPPRRPELWARELVPLIRDPQARAALGEAGRARASAFGVEAHVADVIAVYAEALDQ